jgi:hypothetical protein
MVIWGTMYARARGHHENSPKVRRALICQSGHSSQPARTRPAFFAGRPSSWLLIRAALSHQSARHDPRGDEAKRTEYGENKRRNHARSILQRRHLCPFVGTDQTGEAQSEQRIEHELLFRCRLWCHRIHPRGPTDLSVGEGVGPPPGELSAPNEMRYPNIPPAKLLPGQLTRGDGEITRPVSQKSRMVVCIAMNHQRQGQKPTHLCVGWLQTRSA